MSGLGHARGVRELVVYQRSREIAKQVFDLSRSFPGEERFALTDQIRRSSRSVGAQISEAWAKRRYEKHFVSKLTDADGEQQETQHWLECAVDCGYIAHDRSLELVHGLSEVGRMLQSMIDKAAQFTSARSSTVCESAEVYFVRPHAGDPLQGGESSSQ